MDKTSYACILASNRNGILYIDDASDLIGRVYQHKNDVIEGFTKNYQVHRLVYFEQRLDVQAAIHREKRIKEWQRKWKLELIEAGNPGRIDFYPGITGSRGQAAG